MASNYIIFNNADESITDSTYTSWGDSWIGLTNQYDSMSISQMTSFYAGNSFSTPDQYSNTVTPFQFPLTATTGNSKWIMIRYDYSDASTTGTAHIISIVNALKTYVDTTQSSASLDAEYSNIISQSMSVFFSSTLGLSNVSSGTFSSATYNWGAVDTSGYNYSDGFASSFSGNEGLAWYQQEASPTYITGISENNVFDNITSVHNKKKTFVRASKTIADQTSTALLEKYTKLINLKLLDRLIEVDDYRDAERYALSKLSASEQTTIKNLTRYS